MDIGNKIYFIIITEILEIKSKLALQMFFKVINDLLNSNRLDSILLVFGAYSKMTELDALSFVII